jgi:hypothetical protein
VAGASGCPSPPRDLPVVWDDDIRTFLYPHFAFNFKAKI